MSFLAEETEEFYFPDNFKKYRDTQLYWEKRQKLPLGDRSWVFWSRNEAKPERPPNFTGDCWDFIFETSRASTKFNIKIRAAFVDFVFNYSIGYSYLVQFWKHVRRTMEGRSRSFLTTQHLPFALHSPIDQRREGLCGYRMICKDYKYYVDVDDNDNDGESQQQQKQLLGVPGRVFRNQWPEYSPNVEYYTPTEYPLRHYALSCRVTSSFAFPVFEPFGQTCLGVVEIVSTDKLAYPYNCLNLLRNAFQIVGLKCSANCEHHFIQRSDMNEAREAALNEISKASKVVCEVHKLRLSHIWVPCKTCCVQVDHDCTPLTSLIMIERIGLMGNDDDSERFSDRCAELQLRKGHGVVGRALSSPNLLYCTNISQFSIAEYPMAHYARMYGFSGCFAICLQSIYTANDAYVLEFFFPANYEISGDPKTLLREIVGKLKEKFQSFKLTSGAKLMEELPIEVFDFQKGEKLDCVKRSLVHENRGVTQSIDFQNIEKMDFVPISLGLGILQNGETIQMDSLGQQSIDAKNNGSKVVSAERNNIASTLPHEKCKIKMQRENKKLGVEIAIYSEDIVRTSKMSLKEATEKLNVGRSTLKRACRDYCNEKWPPRKSLAHVNNVIPSNHAPVSIVNTKPQDQIAIPDAINVVTIKAKYGNDITIKFKLSLSWTLVDLEQHVAKRLKLETGTYYIKYRDPEDGELILIACDEDLHDYLSTGSLGSASFVVFLEPK